MAITDLTPTPPETISRQTTIPIAVTLETALYAMFFAIALFARVFQLGNLPLGADEARQAMASWNFVRAVPDSFTGSPLLFAGNAILFFLFGATDTAARILPALFGSLLVLIPALLRRDLGRLGALIASALMLFSPSLVLFSRQANGEMMGMACALAGIVFAFRYFDNHVPRELYLAAIAFALALLASSQVWTVVLALALFVLIARLRREASAVEKNEARIAGLIFILVFVGVATAFLLRREGIGAAFNLLGLWLDSLRLNILPLDPLRLLVLYEPIALFFGVIAVVDILFAARTRVWHQTTNHAWMLWALVAFVLYSFTGDNNPVRIVGIVVPLALIAGWFIGAWFSRLAEAIQYAPEAKKMILLQEAPVLFLSLAVTIFLAIVVAEFALRGNLAAAEALMANLHIQLGTINAGGVVVSVVVLLAIAAITFLAVTTLGIERAGYLGIVLTLTLLTAWTFRQSVVLNFTMNPNAFEWLTPRVSSTNARDLARDVENISRWRANDSHTLTIVVDESLGAIAAWNLREFRNARYVAQPRVDATAQAMLLPASAPAPAQWIGQAYTLEIVQDNGSNLGIVRWLLYRDVGNVHSISAVLWTPPPP